MSSPYLGQIESFPYGFAPKGWQFCAGQLLSIQQNTALFSLLGTTYGGNGVQTFALPDLRGRVAMGQGNGAGLSQRVIGQSFGEANHTLLTTEMPVHTHTLNAAANALTTNNTSLPATNVALANATGLKGTDPFTLNPYVATPPGPNATMSMAEIGVAGGSQPHNNTMPYLAMQFCISLTGIFPSRG